MPVIFTSEKFAELMAKPLTAAERAEIIADALERNLPKAATAATAVPPAPKPEPSTVEVLGAAIRELENLQCGKVVTDDYARDRDRVLRELWKRIDPARATTQARTIYEPDETNRPPEQPPLITVAGTKILPCGGMVTFIANPSHGKTTVCNAVAAGRLNPECDTLGFSLHTTKRLVLMDTELPKDDLHASWRRMRRRARIDDEDVIDKSKLIYQSLRGLDIQAQRAHVLSVISDPGTGIVILDGIGDLLHDVNSSEETSSIISELMAATYTHGCGLIVTIHDNPVANRSGVAGKARGHLGSELCRKSDSVLRIVKTDDQYMITSDFSFGKLRHGKQVQSCFAWSDTESMMVSSRFIPQYSERDRETVMQLSKVKLTGWRYTDLKQHIANIENITSVDTAGTRTKRLRAAGAIEKLMDGTYALAGAIVSDQIDADIVTGALTDDA